jgi:hypothetical protein
MAVGAAAAAFWPGATGAAAPTPSTTPHASDRAPLLQAGARKAAPVPYDHSLNWSGYIDTGTTFTSVAGSWTQPTADCPASKVQQAAFWVGFDGYDSTDTSVEQVGTDSDCAKKVKTVPAGPRYYAWYQMYPDSVVVLPTATYPVSAGDAISASVHGSGADYTVAISDGTRWSFSLAVTAPAVASDASAEWIAEAPLTCTTAGKCKPEPLADFGSVTFTGASANGEPINGAGLTSESVTMTKNTKGTIIEAQPSVLALGGTGFSVTWVSL